MTFGLLIDIVILKRGTSPNPKPEVKLRLSVRHLENRYNIITLPKFDILSIVIWSKSKPEI